jgi:hypothetical protein
MLDISSPEALLLLREGWLLAAAEAEATGDHEEATRCRAEAENPGSTSLSS